MSTNIIGFIFIMSLLKYAGTIGRKSHGQDNNRSLVQTCIQKDQELIRKTAPWIPTDITKKMTVLSRMMCACYVETRAKSKGNVGSKDASLRFMSEQSKNDRSYNCLYSRFKVRKKLIERTAREILSHNNNLKCIDLLDREGSDLIKRNKVTFKNRAQFIHTLCSCTNPYQFFIADERRLPKSEIISSPLFGKVLTEVYESEESFTIPKDDALSCIEFIKTNES
jgi:hypothetical protein